MDISNLCIKCMMEKNSPAERCEHCGFLPTEATASSRHLSIPSILNGKYYVGMVIGEGGFGITYIGLDLNLQMRVAIKEYYPNECATRESNTVRPLSGELGSVFDKGRNKFIDEARVLAKCSDFAEIVKVKEYFQENDTAYIVMEYIDGVNLKDYLKSKGGRLSVDETLQMMKPVIGSLEGVHNLGLIHRDISPDNIMIKKNGEIRVLDFGGARDFAAGADKSRSIMLKRGYAPEEQYYSNGVQGPWTDIYALCATMYRCITGEIPPEALERYNQDNLKPFSAFQISAPEVEGILRKGLCVSKEGRFQRMKDLYDILYVNRVQAIIPPPPPVYRQDPYSTALPPQPPRTINNGTPAWLKLMVAAAAGILVALILLLFVKNGIDNTKETQPPETVQEVVAPETEAVTIATTATEEIIETVQSETVISSGIDNVDINTLNDILLSNHSGANFSAFIYDLKTDKKKGTGNRKDKLAASALISMPILYAVASQIEEGSLSLEKEVTFIHSYKNGREKIPVSRHGTKVSIGELLDAMLTYSDNNAINTLIDYLSLDYINAVCQNAGYTSVDIQRKIISGATSADGSNYISVRDVALITKDLYQNKFSVINKEYIKEKMKIEDNSKRDGIFTSDRLFNGGTYCSQNGTLPYKKDGRYNEVGIIFADGQEYIIAVIADGGNAETLSPQAISMGANYIHEVMIGN